MTFTQDEWDCGGGDVVVMTATMLATNTNMMMSAKMLLTITRTPPTKILTPKPHHQEHKKQNLSYTCPHQPPPTPTRPSPHPTPPPPASSAKAVWPAHSSRRTRQDFVIHTSLSDYRSRRDDGGAPTRTRRDNSKALCHFTLLQDASDSSLAQLPGSQLLHFPVCLN